MAAAAKAVEVKEEVKEVVREATKAPAAKACLLYTSWDVEAVLHFIFTWQKFHR